MNDSNNILCTLNGKYKQFQINYIIVSFKEYIIIL